MPMSLFFRSLTAVMIGVMANTIPSIALAESTSTSFRNIAESVNCGGAVSTSTSFRLTDSACETAAGTSSSASLTDSAGFQNMEDIPRITFALSANSISFGALTPSAVASSAITATVTTNAQNGYTATMASGGALLSGSDDINAVSDGTVTAGSEEYGVRTSGTDGAFNSTDTAITTTATTFASNSGPANNATTLTFKAAVSSTTPSGSYSQTVYLVATGRF